MLEHGYLRVGRLGGVELRLHWSIVLAGLLFGGVRFEPPLWLAYLAVLAVHDLGHLVLARQLGLGLAGIDFTGFGGHCRVRGAPTGVERSWIAWGGMLAQ